MCRALVAWLRPGAPARPGSETTGAPEAAAAPVK
jgi:hypothetical protein